MNHRFLNTEQFSKYFHGDEFFLSRLSKCFQISPIFLENNLVFSHIKLKETSHKNILSLARTHTHSSTHNFTYNSMIFQLLLMLYYLVRFVSMRICGGFQRKISLDPTKSLVSKCVLNKAEKKEKKKVLKRTKSVLNALFLIPMRTHIKGDNNNNSSSVNRIIQREFMTH